MSIEKVEKLVYWGDAELEQFALEEAERAFCDALKVARGYGRGVELALDGLMRLAAKYISLGYIDKPVALYWYFEEVGEVQLSRDLRALSSMRERQGDLKSAEILLMRALELKLESLGPTHEETLEVLQDAALFLQTQGRSAESVYALAFAKRKVSSDPDNETSKDPRAEGPPRRREPRPAGRALETSAGQDLVQPSGADSEIDHKKTSIPDSVGRSDAGAGKSTANGADATDSKANDGKSRNARGHDVKGTDSESADKKSRDSKVAGAEARGVEISTDRGAGMSAGDSGATEAKAKEGKAAASKAAEDKTRDSRASDKKNVSESEVASVIDARPHSATDGDCKTKLHDSTESTPNPGTTAPNVSDAPAAKGLKETAGYQKNSAASPSENTVAANADGAGKKLKNTTGNDISAQKSKVSQRTLFQNDGEDETSLWNFVQNVTPPKEELDFSSQLDKAFDRIQGASPLAFSLDEPFEGSIQASNKSAGATNISTNKSTAENTPSPAPQSAPTPSPSPAPASVPLLQPGVADGFVQVPLSKLSQLKLSEAQSKQLEVSQTPPVAKSGDCDKAAVECSALNADQSAKGVNDNLSGQDLKPEFKNDPGFDVVSGHELLDPKSATGIGAAHSEFTATPEILDGSNDVAKEPLVSPAPLEAPPLVRADTIVASTTHHLAPADAAPKIPSTAGDNSSPQPNKLAQSLEPSLSGPAGKEPPKQRSGPTYEHDLKALAQALLGQMSGKNQPPLSDSENEAFKKIEQEQVEQRRNSAEAEVAPQATLEVRTASDSATDWEEEKQLSPAAQIAGAQPADPSKAPKIRAAKRGKDKDKKLSESSARKAATAAHTGPVDMPGSQVSPANSVPVNSSDTPGSSTAHGAVSATADGGGRIEVAAHSSGDLGATSPSSAEDLQNHIFLDLGFGLEDDGTREAWLQCLSFIQERVGPCCEDEQVCELTAIKEIVSKSIDMARNQVAWNESTLEPHESVSSIDWKILDDLALLYQVISGTNAAAYELSLLYALAVRISKLGPNHVDTLITLQRLDRLYDLVGLKDASNFLAPVLAVAMKKHARN